MGSSSHGILCVAPCASSQHGSQVLRRDTPGVRKQKLFSLLRLQLRTPVISFLLISTGKNTSLNAKGEETKVTFAYRGKEVMEAIFGN